jgi:hypothetical protein
MQQPLSLSDDEIDVLQRLAAPIAVEHRDAFLRQVAAALEPLQGDLGTGLVHRVAAGSAQLFVQRLQPAAA